MKQGEGCWICKVQGLMCCCLLSLTFLIQMRTFILIEVIYLASNATRKNASTLLRIYRVLAPFLLLYISRLRLFDADLERRVPSAAYEVCVMKTEAAFICCQLALFWQVKVKRTNFESRSSSYWQIWSLSVGHHQIFVVLGPPCICWKGLEVPGDAHTFIRQICMTFLIGWKWTLVLVLWWGSKEKLRPHVIGAGILYGNGLDLRRVSYPVEGKISKTIGNNFLCQGERTFNDLFKAVGDLKIIESQTKRSSADGISWHCDDARLREELF